MATARSEHLDLSITPYYHCMARCVRRAFLCGKDSYTGENYEHRKAWVRDRLRFLGSLFAIDVCAYAVMSNHLHVVLHVDEERAASWAEEDVVKRYTKLYPMSKAAYEANRPANERAALVALWRSRLCDLSWMMRALNEFIARKANKEDKVRGRFWEGRFKKARGHFQVLRFSPQLFARDVDKEVWQDSDAWFAPMHSFASSCGFKITPTFLIRMMRAGRI